MLGMGPWHQRVDVLGEVTVGDADEEVAQVSIRLDAIHFAGADQAGEAGPVAAALVMACEQCIAAVHGRAADGVFHQVGVDVDATIVEEQPEAILTFQHIGHRLAEIGFARDAGGLRLQPGEECVDQRAGQLLPDGPAMIRIAAADGILDLVERSNAQERLIDDR